MTKKDLKTGMVVKVRCGKEYLVLKDASTKWGNGDYLSNLEGGSYCNFESFDNELNCVVNHKYDIIEVSELYIADYLATPKKGNKHILWERPTYYNGKVVCVGEPGAYSYTKGKIYDVVDGQITLNNGNKIPHMSHVKSFEELKQYLYTDFIEVVE